MTQKKPKKKWCVYFRYYFESENWEDCRKGSWKLAGETYAVSKAKAINNVRFRRVGNVSQYKPIACDCHWENGLEWTAHEYKESPIPYM